LIFEFGWRLAWLTLGHGGTILQPQWGGGLLGASEPLADSFLGDAEGGGGGAERGATDAVVLNQFSSHERGQCGISVHIVPGV